MNLSDELIVRTVGEFAHILNPFTGKLVSLSLENFKLVKNANEEDLNKEILKTIQIPNRKKANSRKFRTTLINLEKKLKL